MTDYTDYKIPSENNIILSANFSGKHDSKAKITEPSDGVGLQHEVRATLGDGSTQIQSNGQVPLQDSVSSARPSPSNMQSRTVKSGESSLNQVFGDSKTDSQIETSMAGQMIMMAGQQPGFKAIQGGQVFVRNLSLRREPNRPYVVEVTAP